MSDLEVCLDAWSKQIYMIYMNDSYGSLSHCIIQVPGDPQKMSIYETGVLLTNCPFF